jgi:hypothetical protein
LLTAGGDFSRPTVLIEWSGVALTEGAEGQITFRYGDLIEWTEKHEAKFHQWMEECDPVLKNHSDD